MDKHRVLLLKIKDTLQFMENILSSERYQNGMSRVQLVQFVLSIAKELVDEPEERKPI